MNIHDLPNINLLDFSNYSSDMHAIFVVIVIAIAIAGVVVGLKSESTRLTTVPRAIVGAILGLVVGFVMAAGGLLLAGAYSYGANDVQKAEKIDAYVEDAYGLPSPGVGEDVLDGKDATVEKDGVIYTVTTTSSGDIVVTDGDGKVVPARS